MKSLKIFYYKLIYLINELINFELMNNVFKFILKINKLISYSHLTPLFHKYLPNTNKHNMHFPNCFFFIYVLTSWAAMSRNLIFHNIRPFILSAQQSLKTTESAPFAVRCERLAYYVQPTRFIANFYADSRAPKKRARHFIADTIYGLPFALFNSIHQRSAYFIIIIIYCFYCFSN